MKESASRSQSPRHVGPPNPHGSIVQLRRKVLQGQLLNHWRGILENKPNSLPYEKPVSPNTL